MTARSDIAARPELWSAVVGQDRAVAALMAAARNPVHAYLFVGPPGCGSLAAARAFAAAILGGEHTEPDAVERAVALALADGHPDLARFEPDGASLSVDDADEITRGAFRSPVEGARKVLVLTDFERVAQAGPALLKTIEEPPPSTVFVILAEEVPPELVAIASRAVRIDFGPVPEAAIAERLVAEGIGAEVAADAAAAAGGDLDRARLLVDDRSLAVRRQAWESIPERIDGTGATAAELVDEVVANIDAAQEPLDARQAAEREALEERIDTYGLRPTVRKELEARHKREVRRHRAAELRFGLATAAASFRATLDSGRPVEEVLDALDAIVAASEAVSLNANEALLLQGLFASFGPR